MKRTLNKSKWPYLLFLSFCMVAASLNQDVISEPDPEAPLRVSVQTTVQNNELAPPADWIVEFIETGENR